MSGYMTRARQALSQLQGTGNATKATEATKAPLMSHMSLMSQADNRSLPAGAAAAYARLGAELTEHPGQRFACETLPDSGGEYRMLAIAVRHAGFACLRVPRDRFDALNILEIVHRLPEAP